MSEAENWSNLTFELDDKGDLKKVPETEVKVSAANPDDSQGNLALEKPEAEAVAEQPDAQEEERKKLSRSDRLKRQRDRYAQELEAAHALIEQQKAALAAREKATGEALEATTAVTKKALEDKLMVAEAAFADAFERGDKDALAKAHKAQIEAEIDLRTVSAALSKPKGNGEGEDGGQKPAVRQQRPNVSDRVQEWIEDNQWFNKDSVMRGAALGIDQDLAKQGVERESDEYFAAIDKQMRELFPAKFGQQRKVPPVGSTGRDKAALANARPRVKVTDEDIKSARQLGVAIDVYMKNKLKVEQTGFDANGRLNDYTSIF